MYWFWENFYNARVKTKIKGDYIYNIFTLRNWVHAYSRHPSFIVDVKQSGRSESHVIFSNDVIECLICTIIVFWTWKKKQWYDYINGPNTSSNKEIKESRIKKECIFMNFTIHKARYSHTAWSSVGICVLGINWCRHSLTKLV